MPCQNIRKCHQACKHLGYCTAQYFMVLQEDELRQPETVRSARLTLFQITSSEGVKPAGCRNWLYDKLWALPVQPVNRSLRPVEIDTDCLEPTDEDIDNDIVPVFNERQREFFRTNACSKPNNGRVFVTARWHKQFLTTASIIGAYRPDLSQWWPRNIEGEYVDPRVANDNRPPEGT